MNIRPLLLAPAAALAALVLALPASAAATLEGEVTLDYYVSGTDSEGFEWVDADFYAEQVRNASGSASGPLSLEAWATRGTAPGGSGETVAAVDFGWLSAGESAYGVSGRAEADDLAPGEYSLHVLLQDARYSGWDDARSLAPGLLWRGGLEGRGLAAYPDPYARWVDISLAELRNNRRDSRLTNSIVLTLYATYGFGPASSGHTLCSMRVPGLYAGEVARDERFGCATDALPDGEYTLHLEIAENGGRGGSSTVTGPDIEVRDGGVDLAGCCGEGYVYAAGTGPWLMLPLLGLAALRRQARRGLTTPGRDP